MPSTRTFTASRVYNRLYNWARNTSSFAESVVSGWDRPEPEVPAHSRIIYRLRSWPELPVAYRTAAIYRILSVMSNRPVNRHWILSSSRIAPRQLDGLLRGLIANGSIEAIDPLTFA